MKKIILGLILVISFSLVACGGKKDNINVISREEGSGTRSAFVELTGVLEKNKDSEADRTTEEAIIQMQTEGVIQSVSKDENGIGYISTGSLSDRVKALKINGYAPTKENIKDKNYEISRPFILATKTETDLTKDFLSFVNSKSADVIVGKSYIAMDNTEDYLPSNLSGTITIAGSTSVAPLMEKLVDEYKSLNPNVKAEIQQTGSSAGITSVLEGTADIGMSSRELSTEEKSKLSEKIIALDGIAVIVNKENPIDELSIDDVKHIFTGTVVNWSEVGSNNEKK